VALNCPVDETLDVLFVSVEELLRELDDEPEDELDDSEVITEDLLDELLEFT
jgi:hypothetical protein